MAPTRFGSPATPTRCYERHLLFDDVIDPSAAGARETFEAAARSVQGRAFATLGR